MKRVYLLIAILIAVLLCGYNEPKASTSLSLHVCLERVSGNDDLAAGQLERAFHLLHPEVALTVTVIPSELEDAEGRQALLQSIRTQVMSGQGPDMFLTDAQPVWNSDGSPGDCLFPDLQKAMRGGVFLDLAPLLAQRADWPGAEIPAPLLAAGAVDGAQYLLPLSCSVSTFLLAAETADSLPADAPILDIRRCEEWLPWAEGQGKMLNATAMESYPNAYWNAMAAPMLDYEAAEPRLDNPLLGVLYSQLAAQAASKEDGSGAFSGGRAYGYAPDFSGQLTAAADMAAMGRETRFLPLVSEEGGVNVMVESVACVRANTPHVREALDFLCMLFTPQFQGGGTFEAEDERCSVGPLQLYDLPVRTDSLESWLANCSYFGNSGVQLALPDATVASLAACLEQVTSARLPDVCGAEAWLAASRAVRQGQNPAEALVALTDRWRLYMTE